MGNYFKVSQSWNVRGWYQWYWYLHQPSGHIYHVSQPHETLEKCLDDLALNGNMWMKDLTKDDH
jgi:hypothetical protein